MKHKKTKLATAIATMFSAQAQGEEIRQILSEIIVTRVHKSAFVPVAFASGAGGVAPSAHAGAGSGEESTKRSFRIPAGPLGPALSRFATRAGARLPFDPALTEGKTTRGLMGDFTREEGLSALLAGTGLEWAPGPGGTYAVRPTALAQATPEVPVSTGDEPVELDPVIVTAQPLDQGFKTDMQETATKTPLPLRETPQAVSVITQDSLKARQVQDLGQALETSAGVFQFSGTGPFAGKAAFGFDGITVRGIELDASFNLLEDGFISPNDFYKPDLALYERVEVIKGPSSTLYGRGSPGGLVNRVRKKPLPEFRAEIAPSVGSYDTYRLDADVTGPIPILGSDATRGRMVVVYEDAGAFVDGVESERILAAPRLEFDLTDTTRLLLLGSYQRDHFIPNPGIPLVFDDGKFRAPDIRRSLFVGTPSEDENEWEVLTGTAQLEQALGDRWLATLRVSGSTQDTPIDHGRYAYRISPGGDFSLYSGAFEFDTDTWSGEIRLDGKLDIRGKPFNLTFGVDHHDLDAARKDFYAVLGTANIYEENFEDFPMMDLPLTRDEVTDNNGTGVYVQGHFRPFTRLGLLAGIRYDWVEARRINNLANVVSERDDQEFTARGGITFDLTDHSTVYGLYAQSFTPPARSQVDEDGNILKPETGESYEVGLKTEWLEGRLGINAALFRIDREDSAIFDPSNVPGEFDSVAAGLQRSDGFELEINGEPLPGWNLSFGGILLDSESKERDDPFFGSIPGGTADWQVGLHSSYELQSGLFRGLGFGVGFFAIDDRGVSTFVPGGVVDGYERVDLSAFYNGFKPLRVALQIRNLFDERYVEGVERPVSYAQFGSPTAVLLTVRYDFGD